MSEIFISYRREDAPAHAGRLYDGLVDEFGAHQVFMDVDNLEPGVDFVERLHTAVGTADAVLVVIGRGWLSAKNIEGERRLDDPEDFVRLEVGLALTGEPVVIPILVGGATMPTEDDLPPELVQLARRNALTMIDADWRSGLARLVAALRRIVDPVPEPGATAEVYRSTRAEAEADTESEADTEGAAEAEEQPVEPKRPSAVPVPLLATALALAGAAALVLGTFLQVDDWAHPGGGGDRDGLGYFSAVAPMGLLVGALAALALSYSRKYGRIATGVFLGFALAGVARYLSLVGIWRVEEPADPNYSRGAAIALVGSLLLAGAAMVRLLADREDAGPAGSLPLILVLAGAVLVVAGTLLPFNDGPVPTQNDRRAIVDRHEGWDAVETIGAAALAVGIAFLLGRWRTAASGALIGLGTFLVLLFAGRYIGFPWFQPDHVSSVAIGGFVGLAGGAAILAGGLVAQPRAGAGG
jgi:hypothetical protein